MWRQYYQRRSRNGVYTNEGAEMDNAKIKGIAGIKGVASIAIVAFHVWAIFGFAGESYVLDKVVGNFDSMVRLFFILSSFGIFYGYANKFEEGNLDFQVFLSKRYLKIAPAFYVIACVHLVINLIQGQGELKFSVISAILLVFGLLPYGQESIVWGGWSIGIEWVFYLLFPVFAVLMKKRKIFYTVGLFSLAEMLLYDPIMQANGIVNSHINFVRYIPYFLAGIIIYQKVDRISASKHYFILIGAFVLSLFLWDKNRDIAMLMCFSVILISVIKRDGIIFNNRMFKSLGKISYEIYLIHPLFIRIFVQFGISEVFFRLNVNMRHKFLMIYLVILIGTIICAFILNRGILKIKEKCFKL